MKVNLSTPNLDKAKILKNLEECIESGWISTGGKFITEFEEKVARYVKTDMAIGVQSGTAGLHLALKVLGVKKEDEVIVPTLTFIAAVNPVTYLEAVPVFLGCDDSLCLCPNLLRNFLENKCFIKDDVVYNKNTNRRVKAIVLVHVFGNMANMVEIMKVAEKYKIKVLEDATESLGTYYTSGIYKGQHAGTIGDFGVYSFNANKIITTGGGGMVVGKDKALLNKIRHLSTQAKSDDLYFTHDEIGFNYRMLNLQAALGTTQIDQLEDFITTKIKNYILYKKEIENIDGIEILPFRDETRANTWFYSLVIDEEKYGLKRDELLKKLVEAGIQTRPIWGLIHEQKPYLNNEVYGIQKAKVYYEKILNIPCSSNLKTEELYYVVQKLKEFEKNV